ncbi:guanine nucleotide exchange factor MSS4-like [Octopus vulgaris]|uniref:Guanine nucleotide exchange factor MSS4-like n=1 Tax=Octopus vulgaris TaxID=6645 RepID=A0AA36EZK5_OCTVU|nr:guanine nucleotide exchange factor MSS4-like [Octopus vulgaris]
MAEDNCDNNNDNDIMRIKSLYSNRLGDNGKNKTKVYCTRCPSLILNPGSGNYVREKFLLPLEKISKEEKDGNGSSDVTEVYDKEDKLIDCWRIDNMFNFENIGFSNTVGYFKYLICADYLTIKL